MNPSLSTPSMRKMALLAGSSLILMAAAAAFSYGFVQNTLVLPGDADATFSNLLNHSSLFSGGIVGWVLIFLTDLLVAWAVYHFFKAGQRRLSFVMSALRVVYTAFLGVAVYQLINILPLLDSSAEVAASEVMQRIESFEKIWSLGLIVFGVHLLVLGGLVWRSELLPRFWGVLLLLAGAGYVLVITSEALFPNHAEEVAVLEMVLALPMTAGELGFAVWLLVRGGKT